MWRNMPDILYELQVAVYQRFRAVLPPQGIAVYDEPTAGAAFPYVAMGEDTAIPYAGKTFDGLEITNTFHLYSDAPGRGTIKRQIQRVLDALNDPLDLRETLHADAFRLDMLQVITEDPDQPGGPTLKHAVIRYRFKIRTGE